MRWKIRCFVLLILLLGAFVFADEAQTPSPSRTFLIAGYSFTLTGKTQESTLRSIIIPDGDEIFNTEEELVAALERKKQILVNYRTFSSVEYSYAFTNESKGMKFYQVTFTIVDASSILPFPYAKYDSNYGLRLGAKLYDNNFFGRLANLYVAAFATQADNTFKKGSYSGELNLTQFAIGKTVKLDLYTTFKYDINDSRNSKFYFKINTQNLKIGNKAFSLTPWFYVQPYQSTGEWGFTQVGNELNYGPFAMVLGGFSLYNKTYVNIDVHKLSYVYSKTYFKFHGVKIKGKNFDTRISLETNGGEFGVLNSAIIGETVGVNFSLFGGWLNWYNELSQYNKMAPSPLKYAGSFQWGSTLSHYDINWVGDFRKGISIKLHSEVEWFWKKTFRGEGLGDFAKDWYYVEAIVTWFPFASSWFNPSFRLAGRQTNTTRYFLPDDTEQYIGDYVRGVKLDNSLIMYDSSSTYNLQAGTAFTLNCNFTMKFIKLGSFARTYVNPFMDFLVLSDQENMAKVHFIPTIGFEGIGILNKYPGFPVRVSFGINLLDLIDKIKGTIDHNVEYEIFVGMHFYF